MKSQITVYSVMIVLSLLWTGAHANVPNQINFHGTLSDSSGIPLNDTATIQFLIFPDSIGGSSLWGEQHSDVEVVDGTFNLFLGSVQSFLDPNNLFDGSERWLEIVVEGETLSPRQKLVSVPYGFRSAEADHANTADTADVALTSLPDSDWTISGDDIYHEAGNVGVGTSTPAAKLSVLGTLNIGENLSGYDVNFFGNYNGSKLYWNQAKMALRAGWDNGGVYWRPDSIGNYSLAAGYNPMAKGLASTALGYGTRARGQYSVALGYQTEANNWYATALGGSTIARGAFSTSLGASTTANGDASLATGFTTSANGESSVAMGDHTVASGRQSLAAGKYVTAGPADNTIVLGRGMSSSSHLVNNTQNSLMVGFNTTSPTLFVGGTDHRVGIGTSNPSTALDVAGHINADSAYQFDGVDVMSMPSPFATMVGRYAGGNATSPVMDGTFVGYFAGYNNQGRFNTFLGQVAGLNNTTGMGNTYLGRAAGYNNQTGSGNVFIGTSAGYSETGSNKLYIANGSTSDSVLIYGDFATGTVGIGTTIPESELHVTGTITTQKIQADDVFGVQIASDDGATHFLVSDIGTVGIGTTTPNEKLEVHGTVKVNGDAMTEKELKIVRYWDSSNSHTIKSYYDGTESGLQISTYLDGSIALMPNGNGNVGIGTTSPSERLDVVGTAKVVGFKMPAGAVSGRVLTSDASGNASWQSIPIVPDNDWMLLGNNMYSAASGHVGVGVTSPDAKFHVECSGDTAIYAYRSDGTKAYMAGDVQALHGYCTYPGGYGIWVHGDGYAGWFDGDVNINGTLYGGRGGTSIDHPTDPENKILHHNFVESNENLLIYRGKTQLNTNGESVVAMPDYFQALSKEEEASIHITPVGRPFLTGAEWNSGNQSMIIYGEPNRDVFWEVLAERDDPVVQQMKLPVEQDKGPDALANRGELLYPTAYGYPESQRVSDSR